MSNLENIASVAIQRENSLFPFCDTAPLTTTAGIAFPHNAIKDARFVICGDTSQMFLNSITVIGNYADFLFINRTEQIRLTASVDLNSTGDLLTPVLDRQDLPTGFLAVNASVLRNWLQTHGMSRAVFPLEVNYLLPTCLHFYPAKGVRFKLPDGTTIGGPVVLVGENGAILRYGRVLEPAALNFQTADPVDVLRIDFTGDPLPKDPNCDRIDESTPRIFLEDFGGATRDDAGNIQIVAQRFENGTALKVDTDSINKTIRLYIAGAT